MRALPHIALATAPSAAETGSAFVQSAKGVQDGLQALAGVVSALLVLAGLLLAVWVLWRLWHTNRRRQLVFPEIVNASGLADLDAHLPGLTALAREQLVQELEVIRDQVRQRFLPPGPSQAQDRVPLPRSVARDAAGDLSAAIADIGPEGTGALLQGLGRLLLQPRGVKVTATLQRRAGEQLGYTIEIGRLDQGDDPRPSTLWEQGRPVAGQGQPMAERSETLPEEQRRTARTHELLGSQYRAIGDTSTALTHFEAALAADPESEATGAAIRELLHPQHRALERVLQLLKPATRWIAVEHARGDLLRTSARAPRDDRRRDTALVHNFVAALFYRSERSWPGYGPFFLRQAELELELATALAGDELAQPWENLGFVKHQQAGHLAHHHRARALRASIAAYRRALVLLDRGAGAHAGVQDRIGLGFARSLWELSRTSTASLQEANDLIRELVRGRERWLALPHDDAVVLHYNLAALLAVQGARPGDRPSGHVLEQILCALIRDGSYLATMRRDGDFGYAREEWDRVEEAVVGVAPESGDPPAVEQVRALVERAGAQYLGTTPATEGSRRER